MSVLRPIAQVAEELGVDNTHIIPWGRNRAKIDLAAMKPSKGRLILVSAINPTPAGEGKTTMSIALAMGLRQRGRKAVAVLREPSLGPVFGVKGGGTGGGLSTIEPQDDINLHFTGDIHAVTSAHNLLAALTDNAVLYRDPVELDPRTVTWSRALDMNDRTLRHVIVGLGGKGQGIPREARFDITAASEVMAILCLSTSLKDLQQRCARILVGYTRDGKPVRAGDLYADAAMAALLKDALMPNLVQTREGGPAIVHGGPFANIAHGCNSVLATRMGLAYGDDVITEGGFGFDLGGEKFLDIKCRLNGLQPSGVMLVTTLKALKYHNGGLEMLDKHLQSVKGFGLPCVIAVNRFPTDTDEELSTLRAHLRDTPMAVCEGFAKGGNGSLALADVVNDTFKTAITPRFAYELSEPVETKIRHIAQKIYGADDVAFTAQARSDLARFPTDLPVCIAKTHLSLSDQPSAVGRPRGFTITIREVRLSAGAGFIVALAGDILTMPGLPKEPSARRVQLHEDGRISGLMQGG